MSLQGLPTPPSTPQSGLIDDFDDDLSSQNEAQTNPDSELPNAEARYQQTALHHLTDARFSTFLPPDLVSGEFVLDLLAGEEAYIEHMRVRGFVALANEHQWPAHRGLDINPEFEPAKLIRCGGKPWIMHSDYFVQIYSALARGGHFLLEFVDLAPPDAASAWRKHEELCEHFVSQEPRLARPGNVRNVYAMLQAAGFQRIHVQQDILDEAHDALHVGSAHWSISRTYLRGEGSQSGEKILKEKTDQLLDDMRTELSSTALNLCRITATKPIKQLSSSIESPHE